MRKSPHPQWALAHKRPGTELRNINGKFYLYEVSSKWDADKKRAKKVTGKILGKITEEEGFLESEKGKLKRMVDRPVVVGPMQVKEFGAFCFMQEYFQEDIAYLKDQFPEIWQEIVSMSYIRLLHNPPIKNMEHFYKTSFLSESYSSINMGEKRVSALYRKIGTERESVVSYMKNYIRDQDHILFDGTNFVSHSKKIESAKIGYNSKRDFNPQLNILFLFSSQLKAPVFYRLLPGNIRDVKAFKLTLQEAGISRAVVIADKGFYSNGNIEAMDTLSLKYIIPLRRSNNTVNYNIIQEPDNNGFDGYFEHQKRFIWYHKSTIEGRSVYLFHDSYLKTKEENDYLSRIGTHPEKYSLEKFKAKARTFGTLAFVSNLKEKDPEEIYKIYKTRGQIETMIDAMKNVLEMDNSYMQNETALQGWLFIAFIALKWYYKIHFKLQGDKQLKRLSPKDILVHLSEIKKIKIQGKWEVSEFTNKTNKLLEKLNIHIT